MTSPCKRVDGEFVLPIVALGADRRYAQLETGKSLSFEIDALATSRDAEQGGRNFGSRPTADIDAEKPTAGKPPASPSELWDLVRWRAPYFARQHTVHLITSSARDRSD